LPGGGLASRAESHRRRGRRGLGHGSRDPIRGDPRAGRPGTTPSPACGAAPKSGGRGSGAAPDATPAVCEDDDAAPPTPRRAIAMRTEAYATAEPVLTDEDVTLHTCGGSVDAATAVADDVVLWGDDDAVLACSAAALLAAPRERVLAA